MKSPTTAHQRRTINKFRRENKIADRFEKITPEFVEALYEKALAREWLCPTHGPVGLSVNALNGCVEEIGVVVTENEDGSRARTVKLCGAICSKDGPLLSTVKEIAVAVSIGSRSTGVREQRLDELGLYVKTPTAEAGPTSRTLNITIETLNLLPLEAREALEKLQLDQVHGRALPVPAEVRDG